MLRTTPYWRDDFRQPAGPAADELPSSADVAIVGAGITGLNAARVIADAGGDVVVVDQGGVGAGASSVNGGMVNYGLKASTAKVFRRFGAELGREFWEAALASIDLVEKVVDAEGIDCYFHRDGAAELGYTSRDRRALQAQGEWMRTELGFDAELYGPDRIHQVVGSDLFRWALVDRVGGGLHPARYVHGLAEAAARRGVVLVHNAEVHALSRHVAGYQLLTPRGKLTASTVLLATNGYTEVRPVSALRKRVIPVGSYVVVSEPLGPSVETMIPGDRMLWTSRRFLNYFRRTPDDRILIGGRNDLSTDLDLAESAAILTKKAVDIFPELAERTFTHSWTGRLGVTFDLMPHIGRLDGVWYALGYAGHGVGIGTYVGTEVGRRITGELDRSPFEEIPHPTRPYYRGEPWFLPIAARWYRFLDAVGR